MRGPALWLGTFLVSLTTICRGQSVSEQYLLAAANRDRAEAGLQPVKIDLLLAQAARTHALSMADHRGISHQFPDEPDLAARAGAAGARFSLITENVAEAPNAVSIHDLWMKSAGHRANLLDPAVNAVGISVVTVHGQLYAVEDFARSVEHLAIAEQESLVGSLLLHRGVTISPETGDARQTCTMSTGFVGTRQPWFVMRYTASSLDQLPDQLTTRLASGKYHEAAVGACVGRHGSPFSSYSIAVLLYP